MFYPFYYTASNGFKEHVWVCVTGLGGVTENISHTWNLVTHAEDPVRLRMETLSFTKSCSSARQKDVCRVLAPEL